MSDRESRRNFASGERHENSGVKGGWEVYGFRSRDCGIGGYQAGRKESKGIKFCQIM